MYPLDHPVFLAFLAGLISGVIAGFAVAVAATRER